MTHNTTKHTSQDISETSHLLTEEPTSKPKFDFRKLRLLNVGHIKWFVLLKGLHVRLVKLGLQEKWFVLLGTICLFAASGVGLLIPNYVGNLVDQISKIETGYSYLLRLIFILSGLFFLQAISTFIRYYCFTVAGERVVARLRKNLFDSIVIQEIAFFDVNKTGELLNRLASDTNVLDAAVTVNVSMGLRETIQVVGGVVMLFILSWKLSLLILGVVPLITIPAIFFGKWVKKLSTKMQDALARASDVAEESFGNVRTVRSFAQEDKQKSEYAGSIDIAFGLARKRALANALFGTIITSVASLAFIGVVYYGGTLVLRKELTIGVLTSFLIYTLTVAIGLGSLASVFFEAIKAIGATVRVYELLHRTPSIDINKGVGKTLEKFSGQIEFKNVYFNYPSRPHHKVLQGMSLKIIPGKVIALVGESGGGKSTVSNLIQRFYDPDSGEILVDNVPLKELDTVWYRKHIASVSQEPVLFATTIRENILYGNLDATEEEIIQAAKEANAHDFIVNYAEGYNTLVGERGVRLSGGQKQRVAIARALLKNPKVLLLDEFTSALDAESEFLVQQALERLMKGRTVLIIAHRLATVKNADLVCVVDNGKVIEQGTHDELIQKEGAYKKLVDKQLLSTLT